MATSAVNPRGVVSDTSVSKTSPSMFTCSLAFGSRFPAQSITRPTTAYRSSSLRYENKPSEGKQVRAATRPPSGEAKVLSDSKRRRTSSGAQARIAAEASASWAN